MEKSEEIACGMQRAVELTGYPRNRLYAAIADGRLRTWKVGRRRMTTPKYLQQMIEADERRSTKAAA